MENRPALLLFAKTSALAAASLILVSLLYAESALLTGLLLLIAALMLSLRYSKNELLLFITTGILGPVAEMVGMRTGAWGYALPDFWFIPFWLPPLWGLAGIFVVRLHECIAESGQAFLKKGK